jgi:hypothetical protein
MESAKSGISAKSAGFSPKTGSLSMKKGGN